jgi:hypothetical protein
VIKSLKDDKAKLTTYNVSALGNIVKIFDMWNMPIVAFLILIIPAQIMLFSPVKCDTLDNVDRINKVLGRGRYKQKKGKC